MFGLNKGAVNLVILIISIVVAFLALTVTVGIIIWKVAGSEDSSGRSRDKEEADQGSVKLDQEGYIDCGISDIFMSSFNNIFELDFEGDETLVCMGKNIKNSCKKSKSFVKTDDFSMDFKILKDEQCWIKLETYDEDFDEHYYIDCPISSVIAYIDSDYPEIGKYVAGPPGTYAATLLIMAIDFVDTNYEKALDLGCQTNF